MRLWPLFHLCVGQCVALLPYSHRYNRDFSLFIETSQKVSSLPSRFLQKKFNVCLFVVSYVNSIHIIYY